MALSDSIKVSRLFKESQDRRMTSEDKAYYEENAANLRVLLGSEIWMDPIDSDPSTAVAAGVVAPQYGWMTQDGTVADDKAWYTDSGWVPPKCGQGYTIKIYESGSSGPGEEVLTTDAIDWVFDYQEGMFWAQDSCAGKTTPFYVSGYRYTGDHLTRAKLDELYSTSGNYLTQDSADALYAPTGSIGGITQDTADSLYYPSSLGNTVSSSLYTHTDDSSIHFTTDSLDSLYAPSGIDYLTQDEGDGLYSPTGALTQTTADTLYYASSLGSIISSSVYTHIDDSSIHTELDTLDGRYSPTGALTQDVADGLYATTGNLGVSYLSSLSDVSIDKTSLQNGHVLTWDSSLVAWSTSVVGGSGGAPSSASYVTINGEANLTNETLASALAGDYITWSATSFNLASGSLKTWFDGIYSPTGHTHSYLTQDTADGLYAVSGDYLTSDEADALYSPTGHTHSYLNQDTADGLYHPSGNGYFGYISSTTISGGTITTASLLMNANQISGLTAPTYNSGAANKWYVDNISSSIITWAGNQFITSDEGDGFYAPSGLVTNNWSGSTDFWNHSSNSSIHFTTDTLDSLYAPSGIDYLTQDEGDAIYAPSGIDYLTQNEADALYATTGQYLNQDSADNLYAPSGIDYLTEDEADGLYAVTGQYLSQDSADNIYHPSGYGTFTYISANTLSSNTILVEDIYISDWDLDEANTHTVRDWFRLVQSPGWLSGGAIYHVSTSYITSPPTIYVTISGGYGLLREEDSDFAKEYFVSWSTSSNIPITASSPKEYGIEWNSGSPKIKLESPGYAWDYDTEFPIGIVVNRSGSYCELENPWSVRDPITNVIERIQALGYISRDETQGGLILGESGDTNRYLTVTAGKLWARLNEFDVSEIDTDPGGGGDTFVVFIRKPTGGYTVLSQAETQWDNNNYDDNGTLTEVGNNDYSVLWFYLTTDGTLNMIYNDSKYNTAAEAENASPPSSLPTCLEFGGILIGRLLFEGTATTAEEVQSAFDTTFTPAQATDHGNLAGLADDDHTQYHNNTRGDLRYYTQDIADATFAPSGVDYLTQDEADGLYAISSDYLTEDEADALYATTGSYLTSDAADNLYYPSSLGSIISGSLYTHIDDTSIHIESDTLDSTYAPSSEYHTHTTDTTIHYTTDSLDSLYAPSGIDYLTQDEADNLYEPSGLGYITQDTADNIYAPSTATKTHIDDSSIHTELDTLDSRFAPSGVDYLTQDEGDALYLPSGSLAGKFAITGASDLQSWDSARYNNSGIKWDHGTQEWIAMPSGGTASTTLSSVDIDVSKDWQGYGITNMSYISASNISGGTVKLNTLILDANTISGLSTPLYPSSATNKAYVDSVSSNIVTWVEGTFAPSGIYSGWAYAYDGSTIPHGAGAAPRYVNVVPSGDVSFGIAFTADDTNIYVRMTAAGSRDVNWKVEV